MLRWARMDRGLGRGLGRGRMTTTRTALVGWVGILLGIESDGSTHT